MWERILDLVFPAQCAACDAAGSGLCARCFPNRPPVSRSLPTVRVTALGAYDGALRDAILALKNGRRDVARELGMRLATILAPGTLLVPVPTSASRIRERGMDGVRVMAGAIACAVPDVRIGMQLRHAGGKPQQGRSRTDRLSARGRFAAISSPEKADSVALLDDVVTTGATLEDCAAVLRDGGWSVSHAFAAAVAETDVTEPAPKNDASWKLPRNSAR